MDNDKTQARPPEYGGANGSALLRFIADTERAHFRTVDDTGACAQALMLWNMLRRHAGLDELRRDDLAAWCPVCRCYHVKPHVQNVKDEARL